MPGIIMNEIESDRASTEISSSHIKENLSSTRSPRGSPLPQSIQTDMLEFPIENCVETSIEQLYDNVRDMESSSNGTQSRESFGSEGEESRIDSELRHLVGGEMRATEMMDEEVNCGNNESINGSTSVNLDDMNHTIRTQSPTLSSISFKKAKREPKARTISRLGKENPEAGPFFLKHARDLISSDNPRRALKYALRAVKAFEKGCDGKPSLDLAMSLHVLAAIYFSLGQYEQAVPTLVRSLKIPVVEEGIEHSLAKFSGYMQLGDTYAMLGQVGNSLNCYMTGLELQKQTLGDMDPRVGETCRFLAEAHVQALQFDEAEKLCQMALDIHKEQGETASLEETAVRRLMGLICNTKGDHETALEHFVMASMAMASDGQETEVASVDCSIGDVYLSLARYDEAILAYQKATSVYKSTKGENHPTLASVYVRLADLYHKIGKFKESRAHCENALRIYRKPVPGSSPEDVACGFTDVSAIYVSMNEHEQALKLLQKALKIYNSNASGLQSTVAGIEAQMGVLYYVIGNFGESYSSFKNAIAKLRACGEKTAFFGIALNQTGLACLQRFALNEAAELFEEARSILEQEYGPYHPDTLGVYSNLAGTYDAMGRLDEAITILEYLVGIREEKLGTANPDVADEKRRLTELLKEAGKVRSRKARSLENLLDAKPAIVNDVVAV